MSFASKFVWLQVLLTFSVQLERHTSLSCSPLVQWISRVNTVIFCGWSWRHILVEKKRIQFRVLERQVHYRLSLPLFCVCFLLTSEPSSWCSVSHSCIIRLSQLSSNTPFQSVSNSSSLILITQTFLCSLLCFYPIHFGANPLLLSWASCSSPTDWENCLF